jgi:hypothetical protein
MMTDPAVIGAGIARRVADIEAALVLQQSFVFVPGEPAADEHPVDDAAAVAEHLVLRALRTAADPINYRLLGQLRDDDTSLTTLSHRLGLSRIITWERVNDLIQCGLVGRSVEQDLIGLSAAGQELVAFISATVSAASLSAATVSSERVSSAPDRSVGGRP